MKNTERMILALLLTEAMSITKLKLVKLLFLLNRAGIDAMPTFSRAFIGKDQSSGSGLRYFSY
jgi:hypothetical protein